MNPRGACFAFTSILAVGFSLFFLEQRSVSAKERVSANFEAGFGLYTVNFVTDRGTVNVYLPDDMATGEAVSGRILLNAAGGYMEKLSKYSLEIENERFPVTIGGIKFRVPDTLTVAIITVSLIDQMGEELARTVVPVDFRRFLPQVSSTPTPADFQIPMIGQVGRQVEVSGPFDGEFKNSRITVGGTEALILAESQRKLVFQTPEGISGSTELELVERGVKVRRGFTNLRTVKIGEEGTYVSPQNSERPYAEKLKSEVGKKPISSEQITQTVKKEDLKEKINTAASKKTGSDFQVEQHVGVISGGKKPSKPVLLSKQIFASVQSKKGGKQPKLAASRGSGFSTGKVELKEQRLGKKGKSSSVSSIKLIDTSKKSDAKKKQLEAPLEREELERQLSSPIEEKKESKIKLTEIDKTASTPRQMQPIQINSTALKLGEEQLLAGQLFAPVLKVSVDRVMEKPRTGKYHESSPVSKEERTYARSVPSADSYTVSMPPTDPEGRYTVQIASYRDEVQARDLSNSLKSKGYPAFVKRAVVPGKGAWYRVRVGTFRTEGRAAAFATEMKRREREVRSVFIAIRN